MIDELSQEIEKINSNIDTLPTNNKRNTIKYNAYIDECIETYTKKLEETEAEINRRYDATLAKYKDLVYKEEPIELNYRAFILSDVRSTSSEKMNLDYLFYKLNNSSVNNLSEVNSIILEIIDLFKEAGIELTEKEFNFSESVEFYIHSLLTKATNIQDIFNDIFWKTPDIIKQIELNIRYLYYKNEKKLDEYYKKKYSEFDYHTYIKNYRAKIDQNEENKHKSIKYIYDKFINRELVLEDFNDENKVNDLTNSLLTDSSSIRNYENLVNLKKSINEYKGFKSFEYIINDFKELFTHKEEYKDLYSGKLKEISKLEGSLFKLNKKIRKTGLFKLNKVKLANAKVDRNKMIVDLSNLYKELDELKIKEIINKHVTNETNYYDVLKFTTYNFCYFTKLLEAQGMELNVETIDREFQRLYKYIYDNSMTLIDNIVLTDEKDPVKIIAEMYTLNGVIVDENRLDGEQIDRLIENIDKLLMCYDIKNLRIDLNDFKFILEVKDALEK